MFNSSDQAVVQDSPNCITTIVNPSDSTSVFQALFCDPNTVVGVEVQNPPTPLNSVPSVIASLASLSVLRLSNALYGSSILQSLFGAVSNATYFSILDLGGNPALSKNTERVLSGFIPELTPELYASPYFIYIFLENNNFSGSFPNSMSDTMAKVSVANNTLLTGPLPASNFSSTSHQVSTTDEWKNTLRCDFGNTSLCVPATWVYQPGCIRTTTLSIRTCDGSVTKPIDPMDPFRRSLGGWTSGSGPDLGPVPSGFGNWTTGYHEISGGNSPALSTTQIAALVFGLLSAGCIGFLVYSRYTNLKRRNLTGASTTTRGTSTRNGADYVELEEEIELPRYSPMAPEYHENQGGSSSQTSPVVKEGKVDKKTKAEV
ncbi:hypothetical protein BCR33DRAFT_767745 [Rhizoclosmatium globosum]|uniref:L domain-like protein n=1 Tax=Rhizoclosmatium globosum TaxID=329046 RepID=A0A1Y2C1S2_9FUNG|nr:hypothetical protein BCR33DRAFT_767745 [Rhizoclosmatium globosum]|eukprot:ORY40992.1 hypothetical protein BCR33DRAFT_767745 [Rhizoclosmatium globosum]